MTEPSHHMGYTFVVQRRGKDNTYPFIAVRFARMLKHRIDQVLQFGVRTLAYNCSSPSQSSPSTGARYAPGLPAVQNATLSNGVAGQAPRIADAAPRE